MCMYVCVYVYMNVLYTYVGLSREEVCMYVCMCVCIYECALYVCGKWCQRLHSKNQSPSDLKV